MVIGTGIYDEELSEERKGKIAVQLIKYIIREKMTIKQWVNIERIIGNLVKEPELKAENISKEELMKFTDTCFTEIHEEIKNS